MYPLCNQELARHHRADLGRAATYERMSRQSDKRTYRGFLLPNLRRRIWGTEPDFAAIRHDLHAALAERYMEMGTEHLDAVIDAFMQRLRMRLGYGERRKQTRAIP